MNILDLLAGKQPGGLTGTLIGGQQPQTGIGALLQSAQSPAAMALAASPAPVRPEPDEPWSEQPRQQMDPFAGLRQSNTTLPAIADPNIDYRPQWLPMDTSHVKKPALFGQGGTGWKILGALGDAASVAGGGKPYFLMTQLERQKAEREQRDALQQLIFKRQLDYAAPELTDTARNAVLSGVMPGTPEFQQVMRNSSAKIENSGGDLVAWDPIGGRATPVYAGRTDGERYAGSIGLRPGDRGYVSAVQDKSLGELGPTGRRYKDANLGMEGQRIGLGRSRLGIEAFNAGKVSPGDVVGPILQKMAAGQPLTPAEQSTFNAYKQINPINQMITNAMGGAGFGQDGGMGLPTPPGMGPSPVLPPSPRVGGGPPNGGGMGPTPAMRQQNGTLSRTAPRSAISNRPPAPAAPTMHTATDANGNKVGWNGRAWVPVQ